MNPGDDREAPTVFAVPIGIDATRTRTETDSLGAVEVPANHYGGAQTQRSLIHFSIGGDVMPPAIYHAYGYVKKACATVNARGGSLPQWKADLIGQVADEIIAGALDGEFPVHVWPTGSGTQSNMNVNEVIANRASQLVGGELGSKQPIHPNDDVNRAVIGYDQASAIAHRAVAEDLTLREAALRSGVSEELYDRVVVPERLAHPGDPEGGQR